jgi:hypothetical protein
VLKIIAGLSRLSLPHPFGAVKTHGFIAAVSIVGYGCASAGLSGFSGMCGIAPLPFTTRYVPGIAPEFLMTNSVSAYALHPYGW